MSEVNNNIQELLTLLKDFNIKLFSNNETNLDIMSDFLSRLNIDNSFYICDLTNIINQYNRWKRNLPRVQPYYALKSNPDPAIIQLLANLGCNFDCASINEINTVIKMGVDPLRLIFANPIKSTNSISYARKSDVDMMTLDSEIEMLKIKLYHPSANILIRIQVDDTYSKCKFNSKFGVNIKDFKHMLEYGKSLNLNIRGISYHIGSNNSNDDSYYEAIKTAKECFEIAKLLGYDFDYLDIGGGFPGIPENDEMSSEEDKNKFELISQKINKGLDDFFIDLIDAEKINFIAEPGRYFSCSAYTIVMNIIGKREYKNEVGEKIFSYFVNNSVYQSYSNIIYDHYKPILLPFNERNNQTYNSTIFGESCDSVDKICENSMLPELSIGEVIYSENMGSYTAASSTTFNGFPLPDIFYIMRC